MCGRQKEFQRRMSELSKDFYDIKLLQLGCEVSGVDLKTENRPEVIEKIKKDLTQHRLLIFKDQGVICGDRHVEISQWFGELESTFYKHPKSPHPDVFRVSNDEEEGCTGVGRTGWHIDGSFQPAPFSYSLYHMVAVPKKGATAFVPLTELIERLPKAKREEWDRLFMVSDRRTGPIHPLIYRHPLTGKEVLCFHLGMTTGFLYDYGTSDERLASKEETRRILKDIHEEIVKDGGSIQYIHNVLCFHLGMTTGFLYDYGTSDERLASKEETRRILKDIHEEIVKDGGSIQYIHNWEVGDFIISDNLAVGHEATPETQIPRSRMGLRILHRTTVKGTVPPAK